MGCSAISSNVFQCSPVFAVCIMCLSFKLFLIIIFIISCENSAHASHVSCAMPGCIRWMEWKKGSRRMKIDTPVLHYYDSLRIQPYACSILTWRNNYRTCFIIRTFANVLRLQNSLYCCSSTEKRKKVKVFF